MNLKKITLTLAEKIDQKVSKTEQVVSDAWITAKVKSRMLFDKETDGLDINVGTENAVVTLESFVSITNLKKSIL